MRWASALTIAPFALAAVSALSCSGSDSTDAGVTDTGPADAGMGIDAGPGDMGPATDAGPADQGMGPDAGVDMGMMADAGPEDTGPGPDMGPADTGNGPCTYPAGATGSFLEPNILPAFSWPASLDGMRVDRPLDLTTAFCANDPNIDWSPFDVLLFISIPAW